MRALSDFEYEFQMALMNRRQTKKIETVFLMSGFKWFYTSSKLIKEVASLGGSVKGLVPDNVNQKVNGKIQYQIIMAEGSLCDYRSRDQRKLIHRKLLAMITS